MRGCWFADGALFYKKSEPAKTLAAIKRPLQTASWRAALELGNSESGSPPLGPFSRPS